MFNVQCSTFNDFVNHSMALAVLLPIIVTAHSRRAHQKFQRLRDIRDTHVIATLRITGYHPDT
jgi:hypothetical protein